MNECYGVCRPRPKYIYETFEVSFLLAAGLMHNVFAFLVFVGYFMANHPQLPTGLKIFTKIRFVFPAYFW